MSNPLHSEQQYLDIAAQERALLDAGSCLPLNARRDQAAEVLKKNGLPTHRVERYKYCDVPEAFVPNYGLNLRRVLTAKSPYETYRCNVPNLSTSFYLVNNEVVVPSQAHTAALP